VSVTSKNRNVRIGFLLLTVQLLLVIAYIGMKVQPKNVRKGTVILYLFIITLYCMLASNLLLAEMLVAVWL